VPLDPNWYVKAFEDAGIGMALADLDGRLLRVNAALAGILGRSPDELTQTSFRTLTHPEDVDTNVAELERLARGEIGGYRLEKRYVRPDGEVVWAILTVSVGRDEAGRPSYLISQVQDISARKRAEDELLEARRAADALARLDPLTDIANRRHFAEVVAAELARGTREGTTPGLLLFDLDGFKDINDRYGHAAGDAALVEVVDRVRRVMRPYDHLARWGGDEFCVLVPGVTRDDDLRRVGEAVRRAVEVEPVRVGDRSLAVTASVGAARARGAGDTVDSLVEAADRALYAAKREGRNAVRVAPTGTD
jgi:diguanylate cyclase (GGDEF)-like protein/PAS domain S-box-containing protein